jgi:hypothetical protein
VHNRLYILLSPMLYSHDDDNNDDVLRYAAGIANPCLKVRGPTRGCLRMGSQRFFLRSSGESPERMRVCRTHLHLRVFVGTKRAPQAVRNVALATRNYAPLLLLPPPPPTHTPPPPPHTHTTTTHHNHHRTLVGMRTLTSSRALSEVHLSSSFKLCRTSKQRSWKRKGA